MSWDLMDGRTITATSILLFTAQIAGALSAVHALRHVRTAQATTAWCVGLLTLPLLVVPTYWVFGRSRFFGYREALRRVKSQHSGPATQYEKMLSRVIDPERTIALPLHEVARVVDQPVTHGNRFQLLVDGPETFEAMFQAVREAEQYVLVQFFIIEDDFIGNDFAETLIERAAAGVRVYLLYDDIGCQWLPWHYLNRLKESGVVISSFSTRTGLTHRLQVNFRNHRKTVIVDGKVAFTGGFNIGDEYLDGGSKFVRWRDTHLAVRGPAVQAIQAAFTVDWFWARRELIDDLVWTDGNERREERHESLQADDPVGQAVVIPTGPADRMRRCSMMFCQMSSVAKRRIWISTPYFVPNEAVATALETAAARGIEVRVLIPARPDHLLVYLAGHYYEDELTRVGVGVHRYQDGFLHQKAILVDDTIAAIGSTNLDNRSLHLNFEMMVASSDPSLVRSTERMFERDFSKSTQTPVGALAQRGFWFQIVVGVARLFSPVL